MRSFSLLSLLVISSSFLLTACGEEDEPTPINTNTIEIRFLNPIDGEVVPNASNVLIYLEVEASEENHEVEVLLYPEGDDTNLVIDYDAHAHDKVITFQQAVDLSSFANGTNFILSVEACADHDCEETTSADAEFSI